MKRYTLNKKEILSLIQKLDDSLLGKKELEAKEIELTIHTGNYNRRVKYNEKDFDVLVISLGDDGHTRYFAIPASALPDNDSIHLIYAPVSKEVGWSPRSLQNVVEITSVK